MAMEKINGAPLHRSGLLESAQDKKRVNEEKKAAQANGSPIGATGVAPATGDTAEISDKAHQLVALRQALDSGREVIAALPDLRADKLSLARERMQSGFYQSDEVRNAIAERLVSVFDDMID